MKRTVAASLIFIYLFSIGGQLVLHQYSSYLADKFFTAQTAKGLYNVADLTEVKLPVNMPGISEWPVYENIIGQIQFNNVSYNYVKMRITCNALYLMCVPDYTTTRLSNQNIIDAKLAKKIPVPKKEHVPYGKTTFAGNFNVNFSQFAFSSFSKSEQAFFVWPVPKVTFHHPSIPEQPPKYSC